jgi:hypothetical protein
MQMIPIISGIKKYEYEITAFLAKIVPITANVRVLSVITKKRSLKKDERLKFVFISLMSTIYMVIFADLYVKIL